MNNIRWSLFSLLALFLCSCAHDPRIDTRTEYLIGPGQTAFYPQEPARADFDNVSHWDGDGVSGKPSIKIDLGDQRAYFYKGGELVGVSIISSGREGHDTITGNFKLIQKNRHHVSSLYGDYIYPDGTIAKKEIDTRKDKKPPGTIYDGAKMPYFMRIVGGIGMHEGFLPGYPASHGCIRMPSFMAAAFYRNAPLGTPVSITH